MILKDGGAHTRPISVASAIFFLFIPFLFSRFFLYYFILYLLAGSQCGFPRLEEGVSGSRLYRSRRAFI